MERLLTALRGIGLGLAEELAPEEILTHHVFLFADQIRIDVFFKPWGLEDFEACWDRRTDASFESVRIPIVGIDDLIRSKETDRASDRADVEALRRLRDGHRPR